MSYIVKPEDLIGQIEGLPIKIAQAMVDNQVKQGNPANIRIFQHKIDTPYAGGGFNWNKSDEGQLFWSKIINGKQYPESYIDSTTNKEVKVESTKKIVGRKVGDIVKITIGRTVKNYVIIGYIPELDNPYLAISQYSYERLKESGEKIENANIITLNDPTRVVYLTLEDISKGKGVGIPPELIRIKQ